MTDTDAKHPLVREIGDQLKLYIRSRKIDYIPDGRGGSSNMKRGLLTLRAIKNGSGSQDAKILLNALEFEVGRSAIDDTGNFMCYRSQAQCEQLIAPPHSFMWLAQSAAIATWCLVDAGGEDFAPSAIVRLIGRWWRRWGLLHKYCLVDIDKDENMIFAMPQCRGEDSAADGDADDNISEECFRVLCGLPSTKFRGSAINNQNCSVTGLRLAIAGGVVVSGGMALGVDALNRHTIGGKGAYFSRETVGEIGPEYIGLANPLKVEIYENGKIVTMEQNFGIKKGGTGGSAIVFAAVARTADGKYVKRYISADGDEYGADAGTIIPALGRYINEFRVV